MCLVHGRQLRTHCCVFPRRGRTKTFANGLAPLLRFSLAGRPLPEVKPRDVHGFAEAAAAGILPKVPPERPKVLPGRTGYQVFLTFLLKSAICVVVVLLFTMAADRARLSPLLPGALGLICLGLIVFRFWADVGKRSLQEFQSGYTTFVMQYGAFGWGEGRRWKGIGRRPPWDYSGLWVLDGAGNRVVSAPDANFDPPGLYPSPNRPGSMELWTGVVWSGRYRPKALSSG
jgi:hypothetical protein